MAIPFAFFGAGDASYYETASLTVVFAKAPSPAAKKQIEAAIPAPLARERWTKRTLFVAADDHALAGGSSFTSFNAAIEKWLLACHAIAPIELALRAEDTEASTTFSQWHRDSIAAAPALLSNFAKRYDDAKTRARAKDTLVAMMKSAGIVLPANLDPTPAWRTALDSGDAKTLGPLLSRNATALQVVLDPSNAHHRRAVLASRPKLAKPGRLDRHILEMAILDGGDDAQHAIDQLLARAATTPTFATLCSDTAAECAKAAPDTAFAVIDRLLALKNSHPILVEHALWAVESVGVRTVSASRLERYWALAIEKLADWKSLHPYLARLAPVLGRTAPATKRR